jgi:hypothetical protein
LLPFDEHRRPGTVIVIRRDLFAMIATAAVARLAVLIRYRLTD